MKSQDKTRLKGSCVSLSPTYGLDNCPQSLQQLPQGHLFRLHPQDHPPEGQRKTSCPADRHFCWRKRQLACFFWSTSESDGEEDGREGQLQQQTQRSRRGGRGRWINPECDAAAAVSCDSWRLEGRILRGKLCWAA